MFRALMELDALYESANDTEYIRAKRDFKHCVEFADINDAAVRDLVDRLEASNIEYLQYEHKTDNGVTIFHEDMQVGSEYYCTDCGHSGFYYDDEVQDGCCPNCHDHHGSFIKCEDSDLLEAGMFKTLMGKAKKLKSGDDGLADQTALSTDFSEMSIVDAIKAAYETGMFSQLPEGRDNALMLEISGVDKDRLAGYFSKRPEFNYEINNSSGIVSHEFISNLFDIEVFDSFVSMYRIPHTDPVSEGMFDSIPSTTGFKTADGSPVKAASPLNTVMHSAPAHQQEPLGPYVVTIVYDTKAKKLRARANDGVHGEANVAFPNNLRNTEGQLYSVEELWWNGKNYRAGGQIRPIGVTSTNESINIKENTMSDLNNFSSIFEELSMLYEADDTALADDAIEDDTAQDEATEDTVEITVEEDADAPSSVALECAKCGAMCLCDISDLELDAEADLANVDQPCKFCEESSGYKVVGAIVPYEVADETADADQEVNEDDDLVEIEEQVKGADEFGEEEPEAVEELNELLDADITLSLDGGQGNDVDVI